MQQKANEWQELELNKELRKLSKIVSSKRGEVLSITFDIAVAVLAVLVDHVFDLYGEKQLALLVITAILVFIPFFYNLIRTIVDYIIRKNTSTSIITKHEAIDIFDNHVCYCVLTAESYLNMLHNNVNKQDINVIKFYFIEIWYYLNKAKYLLSKMKYKAKYVFTNDSKKIISNQNISVERLANVMNLIEKIGSMANTVIINKNIPGEKLLIKDIEFSINEQYDELYKTFVSEVNDCFGDIGYKQSMCNRLGK